jgi:hypothetical protein
MYAKYMMQTKDFFSEQTSTSVLEQKKYNDKDNENGNRKKIFYRVEKISISSFFGSLSV